MHEEALLRRLRAKVDQLSAEQGGAAIVRARVAFGVLSHLDEPRLRAVWSRAMAGSAAEGCSLDVEAIVGLDDPGADAVVLRSVTFGDRPAAAGAPPSAPSVSPSEG